MLTSFERIRICQKQPAPCGHYLFTGKQEMCIISSHRAAKHRASSNIELLWYHRIAQDFSYWTGNSCSEGKLTNALLPILNWLVYVSVHIDGKTGQESCCWLKSHSARKSRVSVAILIRFTVRLKFILDVILSNEIPSATSFPSLNMNRAVLLSFLRQFSVVVVMLSSLMNSYCLIFFESALKSIIKLKYQARSPFFHISCDKNQNTKPEIAFMFVQQAIRPKGYLSWVSDVAKVKITQPLHHFSFRAIFGQFLKTFVCNTQMLFQLQKIQVRSFDKSCPAMTFIED